MKRFTVLALAALMVLGGIKVQLLAQQSRPQIYPAPAQAKADLTAALKAAASEHKRILLDFGGNWCGDCRALDAYFHDSTNRTLLDANYVLVHVNIGHMDENLDLAAKYQVPLGKGVPALAVLNEHGQLVFSQKDGQFESMRSMQSASVGEFLAKWRPTVPCSVRTAKVNC